MNLRQWARATHRKIAEQPAELHHKDISMSVIEMILRLSIQALTEALIHDDDLSLNSLGKLWVEEKRPRLVVSNLSGSVQNFKAGRRKSIRFRASAALLRQLNPKGHDDNV